MLGAWLTVLAALLPVAQSLLVHTSTAGGQARPAHLQVKRKPQRPEEVLSPASRFVKRTLVKHQGGSLGKCTDGCRSTLLKCEAWCDATPECLSFTYGKGKCWLKSHGVRPDDRAGQQGKFSTYYIPQDPEPRLRYMARSRAFGDDDIITACEGQCEMKHSVCEAWCDFTPACRSYDYGEGHCVLRNRTRRPEDLSLLSTAGQSKLKTFYLPQAQTHPTVAHFLRRSLVADLGDSVGDCEGDCQMDSSACGAWCDRTPECRSFVLGQNGSCHLKSRQVLFNDEANGSDAADHYSTYYRPQEAEAKTRYTWRQLVENEGETIASCSDTCQMNREVCEAWCDFTARCKSYVYSQQGWCWLKDRRPVDGEAVRTPSLAGYGTYVPPQDTTAPKRIFTRRSLVADQGGSVGDCGGSHSDCRMTHQACETWCASTPGCLSFTFGSEGECFLKDRRPTFDEPSSEELSTLFSTYTVVEGTSQLSRYVQRAPVAQGGHGVAFCSGSCRMELEECEAWCDHTPACMSFSHRNASGECALWDRQVGPKDPSGDRPGFATYYRLQARKYLRRSLVLRGGAIVGSCDGERCRTDLAGCMTLCDGLDNCRSFAYNPEQQACFLKDRQVGYHDAAGDTESGFQTYFTKQAGAYKSRPLLAVEGGEVGNCFKGGANDCTMTIAECSAWCDNTPACSSFSYRTSHGSCHLKDKIVEENETEVPNKPDWSTYYKEEAISEPYLCADVEQTRCHCSGFVFMGRRYAGDEQGTGVVTTFEELLSGSYISGRAGSNNSLECSTEALGGDPAPGFPKHCYCAQEHWLNVVAVGTAWLTQSGSVQEATEEQMQCPATDDKAEAGTLSVEEVRYAQCPPGAYLDDGKAEQRAARLRAAICAAKAWGWSGNHSRIENFGYRERGYAVYESPVWPKDGRCQLTVVKNASASDDSAPQDAVPRDAMKFVASALHGAEYWPTWEVDPESFTEFLRCEHSVDFQGVPAYAEAKQDAPVIAVVRDPIKRFVESAELLLEKLVTGNADWHESEGEASRKAPWWYLRFISEGFTKENIFELLFAMLADVGCYHFWYGSEMFASQAMHLTPSEGSALNIAKVVKHEESEKDRMAAAEFLKEFRHEDDHQPAELCGDIDFKNATAMRALPYKPQRHMVHGNKIPQPRHIHKVLSSQPALMQELCLIYAQDFVCFDYPLPAACEGMF